VIFQTIIGTNLCKSRCSEYREWDIDLEIGHLQNGIGEFHDVKLLFVFKDLIITLMGPKLW